MAYTYEALVRLKEIPRDTGGALASAYKGARQMDRGHSCLRQGETEFEKVRAALGRPACLVRGFFDENSAYLMA